MGPYTVKLEETVRGDESAIEVSVVQDRDTLLPATVFTFLLPKSENGIDVRSTVKQSLGN